MIIDLEEPVTGTQTENETAEQAAELLDGDNTPFDTNEPTSEPDAAIDQPSDQPAEPVVTVVGIVPVAGTDVAIEAEGTIEQVVEQLTPEQIGRQKAESDFRERIERLTKNVADAAVEWTSAKEHAKSAKKIFDSAIEVLTEATDQGQCYMPLFDSQPKAVEPEAPAEPTPPPEPEPDPNAWRLPSVNELGLKPKLAETLIEAGFETIGQLEDLRAEISQGRKKWPKGIGPAKVTLIEEAVLNWLSSNRDRSTLASAIDEGQAAAAAIQARMDAINIGKPGCLDVKHPDGDKFWESGADAFKRGLELVECPYVPGPEQDDWLRGWAGQKVMENFEAGKVQPNDTEQSAAEQSNAPTEQSNDQPNGESNITEQVDLDDL